MGTPSFQTYNGNERYLANLCSLVCRFPPFDYQTRNNYYYLRIRSEQLIRVKQSNLANASDIVILPTDDERLKIFIIPLDNINISN